MKTMLDTTLRFAVYNGPDHVRTFNTITEAVEFVGDSFGFEICQKVVNGDQIRWEPVSLIQCDVCAKSLHESSFSTAPGHLAGTSYIQGKAYHTVCTPCALSSLERKPVAKVKPVIRMPEEVYA
jgi:hypothetical protein